jgi:hypothetical protein
MVTGNFYYGDFMAEMSVINYILHTLKLFHYLYF